jgi:hypothetical protein
MTFLRMNMHINISKAQKKSQVYPIGLYPIFTCSITEPHKFDQMIEAIITLIKIIDSRTRNQIVGKKRHIELSISYVATPLFA